MSKERENKKNKSFKAVPIQYHIRTTSDWTAFQIVEGGFWSDIEVECLKGEDRLDRDIVYSKSRIEIHKQSMDRNLVEARVTCKLNIFEDYLLSQITYLITKGAIESTTIRALRKGKEVFRLESYETGSMENPKYFFVPVAKHALGKPLRQSLLTLLKAVALIAVGYLVIVIASLFYCYGLALDFVDFARSNPYVLLSGGAVLGGALAGIGIGLKHN